MDLIGTHTAQRGKGILTALSFNHNYNFHHQPHLFFLLLTQSPSQEKVIQESVSQGVWSLRKQKICSKMLRKRMTSICVWRLGGGGDHQEGDRQGLTLGGYLNSIILSSLARNRGSNLIASGSSRFQSNKNQKREQRELMGSILKSQLRYNFLRVFRLTIACRRQ